MDDLLHRLEKQIKQLIDQHDKLKVSNNELNHGKFALTREKEQLLVKQERAVSQIETLVSKLKAIEKIS